MITTTNHQDCKHENGWYCNVKFGIFSKLIFVCSDCGHWEGVKK